VRGGCGGEIITPATKGGEQKRETVKGITDESGREGVIGMNDEEGMKWWRVFERSKKGRQHERKEGDNSHIHRSILTHINHCYLSPALIQRWVSHLA
jgi:hypothetical protein